MRSILFFWMLTLAFSVGVFFPASAVDAQTVSLRQIENEWARAMRTEDILWFQATLADDWRIVLPEGRIVDKLQFIDALRAKEIDYSRCEVLKLDIRVHGDTATVIGRQDVAGKLKGRRFSDHERRTDVFVRLNEGWKCVTTHVTRIDVMTYVGD